MIVMGSLLVLLASHAPAARQEGAFTSSDVADAAERLTGRRAHMSGDIRQLAGKRLVGRAVTMRIVRDDHASLKEEGLAAIQFVESAPESAVIVVAMEGEKSFAVFGSTFATLARSRGLAGFVIEGAVRGLAEFQRLGFPTFAAGTVSGSAGGHYRMQDTNVPVVCGGVQVEPGDLVVGDEDGVAVAPRAHLPEILAKATALRQEKDDLLPLIARLHSYARALEEYRRQSGRR